MHLEELGFEASDNKKALLLYKYWNKHLNAAESICTFSTFSGKLGPRFVSPLTVHFKKKGYWLLILLSIYPCLDRYIVSIVDFVDYIADLSCSRQYCAFKAINL